VLELQRDADATACLDAQCVLSYVFAIVVCVCSGVALCLLALCACLWARRARAAWPSACSAATKNFALRSAAVRCPLVSSAVPVTHTHMLEWWYASSELE
jgi:hypothetical protein